MLSLLLQILALVIFIALIWPYAKQENWKEKFIDNKHARSILIVLTLILIFSFGIALLFEQFYPIERLDQ